MEKTWELRLEEARREKHRETAEATCQTDELAPRSGIITVEELNVQKQQLQQEADKDKHKAVEETRKQTQRELHKKHLEDMAKQVSGMSQNTPVTKELDSDHTKPCLPACLRHSHHTNVWVFQVEGAVTRAYSRWTEDLTLLPEYQASLQTERQKWEEVQEKITRQQVCATGFYLQWVKKCCWW